MAEWKEQSLRLWQKISKRDKYIIMGSAIVLFATILIWSWWGGRTEYVPLFTNMDAKDAGAVATKLKELKIPFEISDKGTSILVSSKEVYKIRLEMASQGLPQGQKGFEIFEQNKFGATDFQNKVNLLQALQGELSRTIEQMEEVEAARVHIVLPEDSLYKKKEKLATASIMLKLRPSVQLSKQQVKGIVNLVAHSIPSLKEENITVVDNYAKVLNDNRTSTEVSSQQDAIMHLQLAKKISDELQQNIESMLEQVLGPGKAAARVRVELNFDQHTLDRQIYEPVVDDRGIIRSSQETNESAKGVAPKSGGPAGTASNIPGYVATSENSNTSYEKKAITRNYEISEVKEKTISAPGSIKHLSVAVFIDNELSQAQQSSITRVVASTVGFNVGRGDTISVERIPFSKVSFNKQLSQEKDYKLSQEKNAYWWTIGLGALSILLVILLIFRFVKKNHREQDLEVVSFVPPASEVENNAEELSPEHITGNEDKPLTKELSIAEKEKIRQRSAIENMARTNPEVIAELLKTWIADE